MVDEREDAGLLIVAVVVVADESWSVAGYFDNAEMKVGEWKQLVGEDGLLSCERRQLVCRNGKRWRPPYREWRQRVCRQFFELL